MVDIDTDDPEDVLGVPVEATAFLAAVSAFAVLLFVIFVFVNKKWKLVNVGLPSSSSSRPSKGVPVPLKQGHDQLLLSAAAKRSSPFRPPLGDSYILSPESSSDSEEDILRRLRQQMSLQRNSIDTTRVTVVGRSPLLTTAVRSVSVDQPSISSYRHHHPRPALTQQRSFDLSYHPLHLSTPASSSNVNSTSNHLIHQNHQNQSSSSYTGMRPLRVSGVAGSRELNEVSNNASSNSKRRSKGLMMMGSSIRSRGDLISLAEKGKVNGGSSASSTSSEDDPSRLQGVLLRNHPIRVGAPPRPVSVTSSNATTVMATNNPTPTSQHGHSNHQPQPHVQSAPSSTTGYRRMLPPRTKSIDSESPPPSEQGCSTYGDSLAEDDHIFEVEELSLVEGVQRLGTSSPVQCGSIEVAFDYEAAPRKMTVHVIQVRGVPPKDVGGANNTQVRLVLLPERKQKHKTKVRSGENPSFMDTFVFNKVNPEDVSSLGIRFRLYGCERMRRERLLGEAVLGFGSLHLEMETTMWLNFEPRYHLSWESKSESGSLARSDSASSTASISGGIPELMVGLAYNGTTGRLTVEIIKGSHFRQLSGGRAPDSYVKIGLLSVTGQEIGRAKTSLRRAQSNPLFKETFMFQVALFQLQDVSLIISVYGRKGVTRRELLGFFSFGVTSSSGDEETAHWEDMCDAQGDQMCRWHVLQT